MNHKVVLSRFNVGLVDRQFDFPMLNLDAEAVCLSSKNFASIDMTKLRTLVQDAIEKSIQQEERQ